jgi:hypothetical protein
VTAAACPFTPLCERDLTGSELDPVELARLEAHLSTGCESCEHLIEARLSGEGEAPQEERVELERAVERAVERAADEMGGSRAAVLARVEEALRRDRQAQVLRHRRRHLRALFYVTTVAGLVLLFLAYAGTAAAVRLQRHAAQRIATETELQGLRAALARYERETGDLPRDAAALFTALARTRRIDEVDVPWYRLDASRLEGGQYRDDFGRPYRYEARPDRAVIWSLGADGRDDGGQGDDLVVEVRFAHER